MQTNTIKHALKAGRPVLGTCVTDHTSPEIVTIFKAAGLDFFFIDTELRMKDKIVPMFEAELARRHSSPPEVKRMERELFHIQNRVFIINAKEDIIRNLEKVLYQYYKTRESELSTRQ